MMGASDKNRDAIADDIYRNRRIGCSTYCGRCGYNLKTLPHVYTCPECGAAYNARFPNMQGVFLHDNVSFPLSDIIANAMFAGVTVLAGLLAFANGSGEWLLLALLCGVVTIIYCVVVVKMLRQFIQFFIIARRIDREKRE